MTKLLLIAGISGSGKTMISSYVEKELNFARYGIDEWIRENLPAIDGRIGTATRMLPTGDLFWSELAKLPKDGYSWEYARAIVDKHKKQIRTEGYEMPEDEKLQVGYALFRNYLSALEASLQAGRNAVQEGGSGMSRVFSMAPSDEKYVLELDVDFNIAVERIMKRSDMAREKAQRIAANSMGFTPPLVPELKRYWKMPNNTQQELDQIKQELRELFGKTL